MTVNVANVTNLVGFNHFNPAAIPKDLADTAADSVSSRFSINDLKIRYKTEPEITNEDKKLFNKMMGDANEMNNRGFLCSNVQ